MCVVSYQFGNVRVKVIVKRLAAILKYTDNYDITEIKVKSVTDHQ